MIGAGVFILTGMAAGEAGPALTLAFALNGAVALIVGGCYAELSTMIPKAGGAYVWAKPGLGASFGFLAGWMSSFAQLVACSLYASAFGSFAVTLINELVGRQLPSSFKLVMSVGLLGIILWVNFRGAGKMGRLEVLITGLKVAILLVVIAFGLRIVLGSSDPASSFEPFFPTGLSGLLAAMGITFVAFEGYEIIVQSSEEVKAPGKAIPRSVFLSIAIAVTIYVLIAIVMLGATRSPDGQPVYRFLGSLKELGLMQAAGQFVPYGKILLLIAGMASTASALIATVYGSSRIAFAMGRDGDLPSALGRIHDRRKTPHFAIASTGLLMIAMTVAVPIEDIAASTNIMFLLVFVMVCATVIRLHQRWPDRERPFRVPLSPWLPALAIVVGLTLSVWLLWVSVVAWVVALSWLLIGGILIWSKKRGANGHA
jgi:amino acid transporter